MRAGQLRLSTRSQGTARSLFHAYAGGRWKDPLALRHCRAGPCVAPSNRGRSGVPPTGGELLGSLRAVGGRRITSHPGGGGRRKKGLCAGIREEVGEEVEALLGRSAVQDLDLEAVEVAARRQALRLAARALEQ